jgi:hypothetical protein
VIYAPTANRDGEIYPGQPFGGEGQIAGWPQWITGVKPPQSGQAPSLRFAFGTGIFKYLVFNDPNWDYSIRLANWKRIPNTGSFLNATNQTQCVQLAGRPADPLARLADPAPTPLASIRPRAVYERDTKAASYFRRS